MDITVNDLFADVERMIPTGWAIDIYCIRGCLTVMLQDPLGGWRLVGGYGTSIRDTIHDAVARARGQEAIGRAITRQEKGE